MTRRGKNWLEWSVFAVGLVLVAGTIAYLAYRAATSKDMPPVVEVRLGETEERAGKFAVHVTVFNHGNRTAEGVHVEVTLDDGGAPRERGGFDISFLPQRATREGWVIFETDPRMVGQLKARVTGYGIP